MEINIQLPSDRRERRQLSNRIAQRKFRQKRQRVSTGAVHGQVTHPKPLVSNQQDNTHGDQQPTASNTSATALSSNPVRNLDEVASDTGVFPYDSNLGLDNYSFEDWDQDTMDNIFSNAGGFLSGDPNSSPELNSPSSLHTPPINTSSEPASLTGNGSQLIGAQGNSISGIHPIGTHSSPLHLNSPIDTLSESSPPLGKDSGWVSTLHIAARTGNVRILNIVLKQNFDLDEKDSDGRTPLMHAVIEDQDIAVTTLISQGARINEVDNDDRSALHWAVLHKRENVLRILLEQYSQHGIKLDVNAYDVAGWAAIHMAVFNGFEAGVTMLLECGAHLHSKARKCPFAEKVIPGLVTKANV